MRASMLRHCPRPLLIKRASSARQHNNFESASTFAHEYGHAVHSVLSNAVQPWETAGYSTFIAETASIMNEMLLQDMVIEEASSDEEKLFYLGIGLEALRGTFFRQTMFAEFELKINEEVESGNVLTGSKLTTIYLQLLKRYHGHDQGVVNIDDLYGIEWAYIPHFYYDFYVFQYATSIAAASDLAQKIRSENFNCRASGIKADEFDGAGKMRGTTIGKIITVNRGDDNMAQTKRGNGFCHIFRLIHIQRIRPTRGNIAERTGARADGPKDHHGGMFLRPAFTDIGAGRLLAYGDEIEVTHQRPRFGIGGRHRCFYPQPFRATRLRPVGISAFFRMALGTLGGVELGHCRSISV